MWMTHAYTYVDDTCMHACILAHYAHIPSVRDNIFWGMKLGSLLEIYRGFRETY